MAVDVFAHRFVVDAEPGVVFAHLADPQSYVGLSPLVVEVREVRPVDGDGVAYVAVERFRIGRVVRWDNPIRVVLTPTRPGAQLVSDVVSTVGVVRVRLRAVVDLVEDAAGTLVTETVTVSAPAPLRRFVSGQARSVQRKRAAELTRRMARAA